MSRLLSFVIPTYQRPDSLQEALRGLAALTVPANWRIEVIVVENGVRGGAEAVVAAACSDGLPARYLFEPTPGRARALNVGLRACKGEVICTLDDDIVLHAQWLKVVVAALERYPDGMVFGGPLRARWHNGRRPRWFCDGVGVDFTLGDRDLELPANRNPLNGHRVLRREVFDTYGLYREDRDIIGSERKAFAGGEFLNRLREDGKTIYYLAGAGGLHLMTPEQATRAYYRGCAIRSGRGEAEIARSEGRFGNTICGVPLYIIRFTAVDFCRYLGSRLDPRAPRRFLRELQLCKRVGEIQYWFRTYWATRRQALDQPHATDGAGPETFPEKGRPGLVPEPVSATSGPSAAAPGRTERF
jgi:glycosyltransferase involved in cell wall biosynthesis